MTLAAIYFLLQHNLGLPVWAWVLLFFSPDIGMLGYLINNKLGAICYNIFHHKGVAIGLAFAGFFSGNELLLSTGILLFAHSSFDRIMGYGLKHDAGFNVTHLGNISKAAATSYKSGS